MLVVMDAVPARGVAADIQLGVRIGVLLSLAIGLLSGAAAAGGRRAAPARALPSAEPGAGAPPRESAGYPCASRATSTRSSAVAFWIVKWLLAIPQAKSCWCSCGSRSWS